MSTLNPPQTIPVHGSAPMPKLMYGTAWKKERTAELVYQAIKSGFRGIDTAAQPKHYREDLVGNGVRGALADGLVTRQELYIQTKFTPLRGQDPERLPEGYKATAPIEEQVRASVSSSLAHLGQHLDAVLMHSPYGKEDDTLSAWRTLASYVPHTIRRLGISNASPDQVQALMNAATVEGLPLPYLVQNTFLRVGRFHTLRQPSSTTIPSTSLASPFPLSQLDRDVSADQGGLIFQSFHTLAYKELSHHELIQELAAAAGIAVVPAFYGVVLGLGGTALCDGTSSEAHMKEDLAGLQNLGRWLDTGKEEDRSLWEKVVREFKTMLKDGLT